MMEHLSFQLPLNLKESGVRWGALPEALQLIQYPQRNGRQAVEGQIETLKTS